MAPATAAQDPDANVSYLVYIPAAVFLAVCPILVGLRIYARIRGGARVGADDYMAIVSLIFTLLLSGFLVAACQYGMGRHWTTLDPNEKLMMSKYFFMAQIVYKAAINLVKTCILLLYLRIFSKIMWFRGACYFLLAAVGSYCLSATLVTIFQCTPVTKAFHKADPTFEGTCVDNTKFWYANAGFSIATDIIMLLLPMPLVYRLQVPWPQKVALVGVFMLGIFVVITSCLRITSLDILATTPDTSYDIENVMWTIIEPNVAIVCSCLPILRPFIAKLFPALRSRGYYYNSSPYGASAKSGSHAASRNRDSHYPVHSSPRKSGDVRMTTIQRSPSADDGSEEIILQSNRNDTSSGRVSDSRERGIQKTVEYSVEYSTH